jgi:hypothetical protein
MSGENLSEENLCEHAEESIYIASQIAEKYVTQYPFDPELMQPLNYLLYIASKIAQLDTRFSDNYTLPIGSIYEQMNGIIIGNPRYRLGCRYYALVLNQIIDQTSALKGDFDFPLKGMSLTCYPDYHSRIDLPYTFNSGLSENILGRGFYLYAPNRNIQTSFSGSSILYKGVLNNEVHSLINTHPHHVSIDFAFDFSTGTKNIPYCPRLIIVVGDDVLQNDFGPTLKSQVINLEKIYQVSKI